MEQLFSRTCRALLLSMLAFGCESRESDSSNVTPGNNQSTYNITSEPELITVRAKWIRERSGEALLDPQPSGLIAWRDGTLLTIPDGSADASQVLRLLQIDPVSHKIVQKLPISLTPEIQEGCFGEYLSERPDLEALVVDPKDDRIFYSVTEDARRYQLSVDCASRYKETGSAVYPFLLLRMELADNGKSVKVTGARPLQFSASMNVGNHANDGIEGMTFGLNRQLFLALEKDNNFQARIFSLNLNTEFWKNDDFALVQDEQLDIPSFTDETPHPINALAFAHKDNTPWIIAAARNDHEVWLIDASKQKPTIRVSLRFLAEVEPSKKSDCAAFEEMDNYSVEGLAMSEDVLWLINDPWKLNYPLNLACPLNQKNFERIAPLLSSIKLERLFSL